MDRQRGARGRARSREAQVASEDRDPGEFDAQLKAARQALASASDEEFAKIWSLQRGSQVHVRPSEPSFARTSRTEPPSGSDEVSTCACSMSRAHLGDGDEDVKHVAASRSPSAARGRERRSTSRITTPVGHSVRDDAGSSIPHPQGAQAGLSWETILKKRPAYRTASPLIGVARFHGCARAHLLRVRASCGTGSRSSAVTNARAFRRAEEFGSFDAYVWRAVSGSRSGIVGPAAPLSGSRRIRRPGKDLRKRGFPSWARPSATRCAAWWAW
jgi:hypothetical protein